MLLAPRPAAAQMARPAAARRPNPVGPDENWLVRNIVCQCGTCRHNLLECATENCGHAIQDRLDDPAAAEPGQTREQVVEYFIKKYGGQVALAAPHRSRLQPAGLAVPLQRRGGGGRRARLRRPSAWPSGRSRRSGRPPPRPPISTTRSLPTSSMTSSAILTETDQPAAAGDRALRRAAPGADVVWGASAAAAGLSTALVVERMRFGPPLVMLALGGMTLAFTAGALWRMIDPLARRATWRATRRPRQSRALRARAGTREAAGAQGDQGDRVRLPDAQDRRARTTARWSSATAAARCA